MSAQLSLARKRLPCGNTYQNVCDPSDLDELNQRLAHSFAPVEVEQTLAEERVPAAPRRMQHWVLDG